jgi:hypothetical protein
VEQDQRMYQVFFHKLLNKPRHTLKTSNAIGKASCFSLLLQLAFFEDPDLFFLTEVAKIEQHL